MTKTSAPALDRSLLICDYIGRVGASRFGQIQQALDLPKSSLHELLGALVAHGLLRQDVDGRYCLGLRLYELGTRAVAMFDIKREALPILYELRQKTQLTCHLGVLQGAEAIYLSKVESPQSIIVRSWEGRRVSLHSSSLGKALIAWMSDEEIDALLPDESFPVYTERTLATRTTLKRELATVRTRGWAIDDGEENIGIRCLAAPVFDMDARVIAAISVSGTDFQMPKEHFDELSILVKAACIALSSAMGVARPPAGAAPRDTGQSGAGPGPSARSAGSRRG